MKRKHNAEAIRRQVRDEFTERLRRLGVIVPQATLMLSAFTQEPIDGLMRDLMATEQNPALAGRVLNSLWGSPPHLPTLWWRTHLGLCLAWHLVGSIDGGITHAEATELLAMSEGHYQRYLNGTWEAERTAQIEPCDGEGASLDSVFRYLLHRNQPPTIEWSYGTLPVAERPMSDLEVLAERLQAEQGLKPGRSRDPSLAWGEHRCTSCGEPFRPAKQTHHRCDPCHAGHMAAIREASAAQDQPTP